MNCNNCGTPNNPGASFCGKCGKSLGGGIRIEPSASPTKSVPPLSPPTTAYRTGGYGTVGAAYGGRTHSESESGGIIAEIKKAVTSPLFFVIAIVFSLGAVLSFIQNLIAVYQMSDLGMLMNIDFSSADDFWQFFGPFLMMVIYIMAIFSLVVPIVITVGLWLTLYSGFMMRYGKMNYSGFYVTQIGVQIQKGLLIAVTIIVQIVFLKILFDMAESANQIREYYPSAEYPTDEILKVLFYNIIIVTILIMTAVYYHKSAEVIDEIMYSAKTGRTPHRISNYAAIFPFVLAAFLFVALIWLRITDVMQIFSFIISMVCYIISGIALLIYKGRVCPHRSYYY